MDELNKKIKSIMDEDGFNSKFKLIHDDTLYILNIILFQEKTPIVFAYDGTEEDFLKYFKKDWDNRMLSEVKYYTGYKLTEDE